MKKLPHFFESTFFHGRDNPDLLEQIGVLRLKVWQSTGFEMKIDFNQNAWLDSIDGESTHFAVLHDQKIIAASRLTTYQSIEETPYPEWFVGTTKDLVPPIAFISKLVVDPDFQHKSLGDFLDAQCIDLARQQQAKCVLCDVPEYRIEPLKRRGFELINEPKLGITFPTIKWAAMLLPL